MGTLERIASSIDAHKRVVTLVADSGTPIIGLHSYHSDPDTIVSTRLDQEISTMLGLPASQYKQAYSGSLGHPGTEAVLELCGGATRIDTPCDLRDELFSNAYISTNDAPSRNSFAAYHPSKHRYISLIGKDPESEQSTWPDLSSRVIIEKDHHHKRQPFNPDNTKGYSLLLDEMGSATAIAVLQLAELERRGIPFAPQDTIGLIAAIKYAMHVDTQGFNAKQMSPCDTMALEWLDARFFDTSGLGQQRTELYYDLCTKPALRQWTQTRDMVAQSTAYQADRPVFIADLGVVENRMIIPYIADEIFKQGKGKQVVVIFGLYAERSKDVQSNALLFSGRSQGYNGEFKEFFRHCINVVVDENGKKVEKYQGGGRDTGLLDGITMCGNSIPLFCDPHETLDDLTDLCSQEETAFFGRIVEGLERIVHIKPSCVASYSALAERSSLF